ncbi:hypothetical protein RYH75_11470 [Stenotrophomonas geniculata]|uniref:hypothetical protein n=1 Tax=Stenotrophomonas geniculata TaxID=86188 RepID=UPI002948E7CC|nr:hypothetical protein [Stenotrophomonas geniculata]MDV6189873.1 hypothetical protein [Stenotrophomonas geniculata]
MGYDALGPGLAGATKEMVMQVAKEFEIVPLDETSPGDILQMNGCWAIRLDNDYALYLNGKHEGVVEIVVPRPCLRLKDYDAILVDFSSMSHATSSDPNSPNPLVIHEQGHALYAKIDGEEKLFNFRGKELSARPTIQTGPWMAIAAVSGTAKSLKLF